MKCGDPSRIRQHFIGQISDLGVEILESRDLRGLLNQFNSGSVNPTRIILDKKDGAYPPFQFEELRNEDYDNMAGQWGDSCPETIFDEEEDYDPPLDFGPDCPGGSLDSTHQNTEELRPITLGELEDFKNVALKLIDWSSYFRRHLG